MTVAKAYYRNLDRAIIETQADWDAWTAAFVAGKPNPDGWTKWKEPQ